MNRVMFGSVIPLFVKQIKEGQPLTVTDPHMTRFMMSIQDAVDLVLYAFEHGAPGDIFVQKAPAATLGNLALALQQIFNTHNPVKVIGTRHGEKLYETLLTREEMGKAEDCGGYYRIPADTRDLNYEAFFSEGSPAVSQREDYHSHNTRRLDVEETAEMLLKLHYIQAELMAWHR
jgi:UDP-N-acetylglucosamine 4,6-dehydratase/5-epimerase